MDDQSLNFNPLPPTNEAQTIIQQTKGKLPKLELDPGERLCISREQLETVNKEFYELISDMKQGTAQASAELHSYMDSVAYYAYVEEIAKLRRDNMLECNVEWETKEGLTAILTPRTWRGLFFRKKRNQAQVLLDELIGRQAWNYLKRKQDELPAYNKEQETVDTPYTLQLEALKNLLPRKMRKKKRAAYEEILAGLLASYESKTTEQKHTAEELKEVKKQLRQEQERIIDLTDQVQRMTEALVEESESIENNHEPKQEPNTAESSNTPEEAEAEETPGYGDGDEQDPAETADGDERRDLYFGELDECDE